MTALKAVVFDKDGTLFDFASTWEAWAHAFLKRLVQDDVAATRLGREIGFDFVERKFTQDSVVIAGTPDQLVDLLLPHLPEQSPKTLLDILNAEAACAPQSEAVPLDPFLQGLRAQGYRLGVVTNDAEEPARAHLGAAGVTHHFDFIAGFDSGFGAKPAPGQLDAFARMLGVEAGNVVMVGDSTHDLLAAQRAGMRAVGVLTGIADRAALKPYAEVVFPDIGYLPAWLDAQNQG